MLTRPCSCALLLVLVLAGQQKQVAQAWWLSPDAERAPEASKPQPASVGPSAPSAPAHSEPSALADYQQPQAAPAAAAPVVAEPIRAMAKFDLDGVKGLVRFSQAQPGETTKVEYDLTGLRGNNKFYHVHVRPVPKFNPEQVRNNASAIAKLCADPSTGGHLNPHHITEKLPPKSAPLEKYEIGDLSGKHGPLSLAADQRTDRYVGSFQDDRLPMAGEHSIIGRSLVIHKNDGSRWVCASIEPVV